jgi:hypothetical protein
MIEKYENLGIIKIWTKSTGKEMIDEESFFYY